MTSFILPAVGGRALEAGLSNTREQALTILGVIGNIGAGALALTPIVSFLAPICREQAVGDRTAYGHILTLFSSATMFLYAFPSYYDEDVPWSLYINGASTLLQLTYVAVFIWFAAGAARSRALSVLGLVLLALAIITPLVITKVIWGSRIMAGIAGVAAFLSYCSIVVDMMVAAGIEGGDNRDPLYEVLLGLINASASTAFGFLCRPMNLYTALPNVVGVVVLLVQMVMYVIHCNPQLDEPARAPAEPEPERNPEPEPERNPEPEPEPKRNPEPEHDPIHTVDVANYGFDLTTMFSSPV